MAEGQRRLEAMLDRLVMLYLLHTLEVPSELHDWAVASANRRYGNYRDAVRDRLAGKDGRGIEDKQAGRGEAASST